MTLYSSSGQINTTQVNGNSYTGLYAADGSWNIVLNTSNSYVGLHHPCGALNAVVTTNSSAGFYAPNGSMYVIASGSGYSPVVPTGIFGFTLFKNFTSSNTTRLQAAMTRVRNGTGNCRILFMGESNTAGTGAGTGAVGTVDASIHSYSYQFASLLNSSIPTHEDSFFGIGAADSGLLEDSRRVFGAGWVHVTSTLGGQTYTNTTTTNPVTFTPLNNVDTFKVYYIISNNKTAKMNVTIDGGAPTTGGSIINAFNSSATSVGTATFTASSPGSHALALARDASDSNGFALIGIEAWDSTRSMVSIMNAGASGNKASNIGLVSPPPYSSLTVAVNNVAPDVVVLWEAQNDWTAINGSTETAVTYNANMQAIITALLPVCDVIIASIGPVQTTTISTANQALAQQSIYTLAQSNNLPIFDPGFLLGSWTNANANGDMFNAIHETVQGYGKVSNLLYTAISPLIPPQA